MHKFPTVTVNHLIHHESGLHDYVGPLVASGKWFDQPATQAQAIELAMTPDTTSFDPGTRFEYCNTNYVILAEVVAAVDGRTFQQFLSDEIFVPAGLTDTKVPADPGLATPGMAVSYAWHHGAWITFPNRWEQLGDGSVRTTASDLARWAEHFRASPLIADRAFVGEQLSGGQQLENLLPEIDRPCRYAAGLVVVAYDDRQVVHHSGNWVGYWSGFFVDRTAGTSVIVLANGAARPDLFKIGFGALDTMAPSNRQPGQET